MTQSRYAPAVLAIAHVPMNGAIFPREEMRPADWIGKPVTIDHPKVGSSYVSATDKDAVGEIVNAWVEGDKLKGTIKVDVSRVPRRVLDRIERGEPIDVSTGYLANEECPSQGYCIHRNIRPDHLAIVPTGACSWADGCGIRSHMKVNHVTKTRFQSNKHRYSDKRPMSEDDIEAMIEDAFAPLTAIVERMSEVVANCLCRSPTVAPPVANRSVAETAATNYETRPTDSPERKRLIEAMNASARDNEARRRRSDEYIARNPAIRRNSAANSNDPAVQAMNEYAGGLVAHFQKRGK